MSAGIAGGLALCVPALVLHAGRFGGHRPAGSFAAWAVVVTVVATAEEVFLRGALYDAVAGWSGEIAAVLVAAVAFAALHVPLYGWGSVPIDLAAGIWLGALRAATGSVVAPAAAHTVADWVGWWLR